MRRHGCSGPIADVLCAHRSGGRPLGCIPASGPDLAHRLTPSAAFMFRYAIVFLLLAIMAAVFGFGGLATRSAGIAKILFFVFIVIFLVALTTGTRGGRRRSGV